MRAPAFLRRRRAQAAAPPDAPDGLRDLLAERDRLSQRFTLMQAELGGIFYEMAIRDHVRMEVLTRKAAELQRVDEALEAVERAIRGADAPPVAACPTCGTPHGERAVFCSQCGTPLGAAPADGLHHVNGSAGASP